MRWFFLFLILVLLPFFFKMSTFILTIINLTMIYTLAAMGLNLIMGYTGQVSIGHGAFMSIGAYTSAILVLKLSVPLPFSILIATILSGVFGLALGFPALRLFGFYLAITTMGFAVAVEQLIGAWEKVTGGHIGMRNIPRLGNELQSYYIILVILIICIYVFQIITSHRTGRALKAIRENPMVATTFGVNLTYFKVLAFVIGSAYAGLAGAIYAHTIGYIAPHNFGLGKSLELLAIVVIGGMGITMGPIFGSALYTILPFFFSRIGFSTSIIFGSILVLVVLFMPRGIAYYFYNLWLKFGELPIVLMKRVKKSNEGKDLQLSFGKMHYIESGNGEKVVLCIHGNFGSCKWFKPLMARLKNKRILAVDLPNFGDSSRADSSLQFYARAVNEFIEKMQIKPAVVAHSLGGAVGMLLAINHPESLRSLVLVDPCPVDGLTTPTENMPYLELYKTNRSIVRKSIVGLLKNVKDRKFVEQLVDDALKMNPDSVYPHADELGRFNIVEKAKSISVPVLVLWGELDTLLTRKQMERTAQALNGELRILKNIGHSAFVEDPDLFIDVVKDYL
ncbi:alpha/beta fold hydrolase [Thermotoga profunda]|uniref:alpha/beta fold hydrolase n=1 Tax=Thermotoga profunda TaxID=1508420 RepID=UPI000596D60F|nr:alpha/beta fold hydrolase [Thermotoga profunda]